MMRQTFGNLSAFLTLLGVVTIGPRSSVAGYGLSAPVDAQVQDLIGKTSHSTHFHETMNFGVLINNPYYRIYRSGGLGRDGLIQLSGHLIVEGLPFPRRILYLNSLGFDEERNDPIGSALGFLKEGLENLLIRTRARLVGSGSFHTGNFADEERDLALGSTELRIPSFEFLYGGNRNIYISKSDPVKHPEQGVTFKTPEGTWVEREGGEGALYQVLKEILTSEGPVLFHCKGGIHRTGMTGLMIRYLQGGVWTAVLPDSMRRGDTTFYHVVSTGDVTLSNLAEFEYWQHNSHAFLRKNLRAIRQLSGERRFQCLKEEFGPYLNYSETPGRTDYPPFDRNAAWERCNI